MKNNKGIIGKSAILNMIEQLAENSSEALIWMYLVFFSFVNAGVHSQKLQIHVAKNISLQTSAVSERRAVCCAPRDAEAQGPVPPELPIPK